MRFKHLYICCTYILFLPVHLLLYYELKLFKRLEHARSRAVIIIISRHTTNLNIEILVPKAYDLSKMHVVRKKQKSPV